MLETKRSTNPTSLHTHPLENSKLYKTKYQLFKQYYLSFLFTYTINLAFGQNPQDPVRVEMKYQCDIDSLKVPVVIELEESPNGWYLDWEGVEIPEGKEGCELWLNIFENDQPIAYYKGLSTPMTFSYFSTSSDSIDLSFSLGNMWKKQDCFCFFKQIKVPVIRSWKDTLDLAQDRDWYFFKYLTMNQYEESLVNRDKYMAKIVTLNRSLNYLNLSNGKVASGSKWMRKGNVYKISEKWELAPVYPYQEYKLLNGEKLKGTELIEQGKVDLDLIKGLEKQFYLKKYAP